MTDELTQFDEILGLDDLNQLSDDAIMQMEDVVPIDPPIDSTIDPTIDPTINPQWEPHSNFSFKGGACVCSCDMSCTVGY